MADTYEYRIIAVPSVETLDEATAFLNTLGADGWIVFHLAEAGGQAHIYMLRRAEIIRRGKADDADSEAEYLQMVYAESEGLSQL